MDLYHEICRKERERFVTKIVEVVNVEVITHVWATNYNIIIEGSGIQMSVLFFLQIIKRGIYCSLSLSSSPPLSLHTLDDITYVVEHKFSY